ncbi:hypothetical protein ACPA9J_12950 [Pseudomonas aeruginosa]
MILGPRPRWVAGGARHDAAARRWPPACACSTPCSPACSSRKPRPPTRRRRLDPRRMNALRRSISGLARQTGVGRLLAVLALVFLGLQAVMVVWPFFVIEKFHWAAPSGSATAGPLRRARSRSPRPSA